MAGDMTRETAHFRGEGGAVFEMDLPLSEVMQEKLLKGYLTPVDADGQPNPDAGGLVGVLPAPGDDGDQPEPPARTAPKAEWVGYAVHVGGMTPDDADAMTKADLIEEFG